MVKNKLKAMLDDSVGIAKGTLASIIDSVSNEDKSNLEHTIAALVKTIMSPKAVLSANDIESFRVIWKRKFPVKDVDRILGLLYSASNITVEEASEKLLLIPENRRIIVLTSLMDLAANSDNSDYGFGYLKKLSHFFKISAEHFEELKSYSNSSAEKRQKLLRSGTGIIVALVVIAIFILTATLLKSVIFGLLLAFLMLPVEKFYELKLKQKNSTLGKIFNFFGAFVDALKSLGSRFRSRSKKLTSAEEKKKQQLLLIRRAVSLTSFTLLLFVTALVIFFGAISLGYLNNLKVKVNNWASEQFEDNKKSEKSAVSDVKSADIAVIPESEHDENRPNLIAQNEQNFLNGFKNYLEQFKYKFESNPIVKHIINELSIYLNDPASQREFAELISSKTGGFLTFTGKVLGAIGDFLLNILLTIFFFLLFLTKIAEFTAEKDSKGKNYFIRTIFNGNWLPKATEDDLKESERIIGELGHKLKVWLRGYLLLMSIDFSVYSIAFYFLNVPYFLILGAIAGCGILLPFIGPIASAIITVLVTLAVGGSTVSGIQIAGILGIYLLHNGITEQFILYPVVIGESLGLTTLETIIVVLLGGIFAGITGMIFAIPAAAVIKYIIPQIYKVWH